MYETAVSFAVIEDVEAVFWKCSVKKLLPQSCNVFKIETLVLVFSWEFCDIFWNSIFLQDTSGRLHLVNHKRIEVIRN